MARSTPFVRLYLSARHDPDSRLAALAAPGVDDFIEGSPGPDTLNGTAGNDTLRGLAGADSLLGGLGDDRLSGDAGNDTLVGGDGIDGAVFRFDESGAAAGIVFNAATTGVAGTIVLNAGIGGTDTLVDIEYVVAVGTGFADRMTGGIGGDVLIGGGGTDTLNGGEGADFLSGLTGFGEGEDPGAIDADDTLNGGNGNDTLRGNSGNDSLNAGAGDDNLRGDAGNDLLIGGAGIDFVSYRFDEMGLGAGVSFSTAALGSGGPYLFNDGRGGIDTVSGVEKTGITGTVHNDTLSGGTLIDQLDGAAGNDSLDGGGGSDGPLFGRSGNDTINGGAGNDELLGGAGDDSLIGGIGSADIANYEFAPGAITASLLAGTASGAEGNDVFSGIENLTGSAYNDTLTGSAGVNALHGGAGNDTVAGGAGNDQLFGDAGIDWLQGDAGVDALDGGDGNDLGFFENGTQGADVNLQTGVVANDGFGNAETITLVENLHGTRFADQLVLGNADSYVFARAGADHVTGGAGGNWLNSGSGADTVDGGGGFDTFVFADEGNDSAGAITLGAVVNLVTGVFRDGWGHANVVTNVEQFQGSALADRMTGAGLADVFQGNGGADTLAGGDANDALYGFMGSSGEDPQAQDGADVITGGNGNDLLRGNSGNDSLNGGADDDNIRGDGGDDTLIGGTGSDFVSYRFDELPVVAGISFSTAAIGTAAVVTLSDGRGGTDTVSGMEKTGIGGTAFNDTLSGGLLIDQLDGGAGDDSLSGGGGDDSLLRGGLGNDTLSGGVGNDALECDAGSDRVTGGTGNDLFQFTVRDGSVDRLVDFASGADVLQLDHLAFGALGAPGALASGAFVLGTAAADADDRIVYETATGKLWYDADGNGAGAAQQFALLTAGTTLLASDILVI